MSKFDKFVYGACTLIELGSIVGLAVLGLKRNQECYEAQMECSDLRVKPIGKEIDACINEGKIKLLEREVNDLKAKYEPCEEEEA